MLGKAGRIAEPMTAHSMRKQASLRAVLSINTIPGQYSSQKLWGRSLIPDRWQRCLWGAVAAPVLVGTLTDPSCPPPYQTKAISNSNTSHLPETLVGSPCSKKSAASHGHVDWERFHLVPERESGPPPSRLYFTIYVRCLNNGISTIKCVRDD